MNRAVRHETVGQSVSIDTPDECHSDVVFTRSGVLAPSCFTKPNGDRVGRGREVDEARPRPQPMAMRLSASHIGFDLPERCKLGIRPR